MTARDDRPDTVRECCARWAGWRALKLPTLWEIEVLDYIERLEAEVDEWREAYPPPLNLTGTFGTVHINADEVIERDDGTYGFVFRYEPKED